MYRKVPLDQVPCQARYQAAQPRKAERLRRARVRGAEVRQRQQEPTVLITGLCLIGLCGQARPLRAVLRDGALADAQCVRSGLAASGYAMRLSNCLLCHKDEGSYCSTCRHYVRPQSERRPPYMLTKARLRSVRLIQAVPGCAPVLMCAM
jgi:hypothetical protein